MHEESIARAILSQIRDKISDLPGNSELACSSMCRVSSLTVSCGELSGVDAALLSLALQRLCAVSGQFEDCECHVRHSSLVAHCNDCQEVFQIADFVFRCPCGSQNLRICDGERIVLESFTLTHQGEHQG